MCDFLKADLQGLNNSLLISKNYHFTLKIPFYINNNYKRFGFAPPHHAEISLQVDDRTLELAVQYH